MKVICINDEWQDVNNSDPKIGDTATVISSYQWGPYLIYLLQEFPRPGGYAAAAFAPISDIDETTFERNYNKELV